MAPSGEPRSQGLPDEALVSDGMSGTDALDVVEALKKIENDAAADLTNPVEVSAVTKVPEIGKLPLGKNDEGKFAWRKIEDASVVSTDLKSSTAVSYSKQDRVGARLYEASTGGAVDVLNQFNPDFVDIQGDGVFAVFSGELHAERAMCAAVTLNGFGRRLAMMLAETFGEDVPEMKESGLKIGVDRGTLLVKRIGVRGDHNEPVWAGKPVVYATKCAQEADAGKAIVTSRFFRDFKDNEFVRFSCGCQDGQPGKAVAPLWRKVEVEALGQDSDARELLSTWCERCGTRFCRAILAGETEREGLNTGSLKKWRETPQEQQQTA